MAQTVKSLPAMQEIQVQSLGWDDPLEKGMATHPSILAWRIPWTEKPGRLESMSEWHYWPENPANTHRSLEAGSEWSRRGVKSRQSRLSPS